MILRVLLASRMQSLAQDIHQMVIDADVVVDVTADSAGLWEHLQTNPCDLLVADRELLGARPRATFAEIQELPDSPQTIVLLSADDPETRAELLDAGALACLASDIERRTLYRTIRALVRRTTTLARRDVMVDAALDDSSLSDFASRSSAMQRFLKTVRKVVNTSSSLLLLGETGVGKEYLARAIHREGARGNSPFVAVNCAALPETLLESELFGHEKGAFTGAQKARRGYFELANSGTIFLDEIAELPVHLQVKLLRVLQEREFQPVGSEKVVRVDVRVIAATNQDIEAEIRAKRFRADLYYRLGVVTLTVPALRDRREDIPDLVTSHIEHFRKTLARPVFGIEPEAMELCLRHSWPGNVRELVNVVERAVLLAEGEEVTVADLPDEMHRDTLGAADDELVPAARVPVAGRLTDVPLHAARATVLDDFERRYIQELLEDSGGRIGRAALKAGITPRSLYEKMKRFGLRKESFRGARHS